MSASAAAAGGAAAAASSSSSSPLTASSSSLLSEDARLDSLVASYLSSRGYHSTSQALKAESKRKEEEKKTTTTASSSSSSSSSSPASSSSTDIHTFAVDLSLSQHVHFFNQILHYSLAESNPEAFFAAYDSLKRWIADCMEIYRSELTPLLWPLYVHIFLQLIHRGLPQDAQRFLRQYRAEHEIHVKELLAFQNIMTESELQQKCEPARYFLGRKSEVTLSSYAHQLLLAFLHERHSFLLLKLVNDHCYLKIISRRPVALQNMEKEDIFNNALQHANSLGPGSVAAAAAATTNHSLNPTPHLSGPSSFTSLNPLAILHLNSTPIRWGVLQEVASLHSEAANQLRSHLLAFEKTKKDKKNQELIEANKKKEEERAVKETENKVKAIMAAAAGVTENNDAEMEQRKKAKVDPTAASAGENNDMTDVAVAATSASASPNAGAADAAEGVAGKKSKKAKKKDAGAHLHAPDHARQNEAEEERQMIDNIVEQYIHVPLEMRQPINKHAASAEQTNNANTIKLPPFPSEARLRYLSNLTFRQKLSPSSLPSVAMYTFLNGLASVSSVRFGRDGSLVATGHQDSSVRVYDLRDANTHVSTNPHAASASASAQAAAGGGDLDHQFLTSESQEHDFLGAPSIFTPSIIQHGRRNGEESQTKLPYSKLIGHSGAVTGLSFSPDTSYLLSSSEDSCIRLWHLSTKKPLVVYRGHTFPVWDVAFSPLGYYFASGGMDTTARIWSTNNITPLRMMVGHTDSIDSLKWHPNCNYLATASADSTARLWDIQTGECVRLFLGHAGGGVTSLAMDPEGGQMATGGADGKLMLWDLGSGRSVTSSHVSSSPITSIEYSADGDIIAAGSLDGRISLLSSKKPPQDIGRVMKVFKTKNTSIQYLQFTQRNLLLAAGVFNG